MKKPELLAPAGNMESLKAAIQGGCDAVYIGGKFFSARQYSDNFSNEELKEAITYAHLYGVKVYITVNTLIYEAEVEAFMTYIDYLVNIGIDALIIQDIGMLDLISKTYPTLELHASTQMHIHNLYGAKLLEKLGVKRTVLARETKLEDIKNIKENTNIEIEIFVHGALCVSYSGECLMSSLIGGRSGNRGTCSQCCRMMYTLENDHKKLNSEDYLLSMKDLNTLPYLEKLLEIGVDSLKIEGRMKRKEYVYLVTKIYRKAIDSYFEYGKVIYEEEDIKLLKKMFNREFTKGFIFDETNENVVNQYRPNHMGIELGEVIRYENNIVTIKLYDDLMLGDGIRIIASEDYGLTITSMFINRSRVTTANKGDIVSFKIEGNIKVGNKVVKTSDIKLLKNLDLEMSNNNRKVNIDGKITIIKNEPIKLKILCDDMMIECESEYLVEDAINSPTTKQRVITQISKLGDTPYKFNDLTIEMDDDVFVKIDELNLIRRNAIKKLSLQRCKIKIHPKEKYDRKVPQFQKEKKLNLLVSNKEDYEALKDLNIDEWITDSVETYYSVEKSILKIPRVITKFKDYHEKILVGELGSVYHYDMVDTDFSLNVTNSYTIALLHSLGVNKITLSYELNINQITRMLLSYKERYNAHPNVELIIYSRPEVMISKFNMLEKYNIESAILKDKFNNEFPVKIKDDLMYIYLYRAIIHKNYPEYYNLGINHMRINVLDKKDIEPVLKLLKKKI